MIHRFLDFAATRRRACATRLVGACLALGLPGLAPASDDASLGEDLVEVRDGKLVFESYTVCGLSGHFGWPDEIKLRQYAYAEAPSNGVISRDNFVAAIAVYLTAVEFSLATEVGVPPMQAFGAFDCDDVDAFEGKADVEIRMTMDGGGMNVEVLDTTSGQVIRRTLPWQ